MITHETKPLAYSFETTYQEEKLVFQKCLKPRDHDLWHSFIWCFIEENRAFFSVAKLMANSSNLIDLEEILSS